MKTAINGKKLLSLCLALLLVLALLPMEAFAADNLSYDPTGDPLKFTGSGDMQNYTRAGAPWYSYRDKFRTVTFANDSITSVGNYAFWGFTKLSYVNLASRMTRIGDYAFSGCSSLQQIKVRGSSSINQVEFPTTITSIGSYAFENCSSLLGSFSLPSQVTVISDGVFSGCTGLTGVGMPLGVTSIGNDAFRGCSMLQSIELPSTVTSIGSGAFQGCGNLNPTSGVTVPSGVTMLNDYVFFGCSGLEKLTLPAGLTAIGQYALSGCSSLKELTIPSKVKTISSNALDGCAGLEELILPAGVTQIGSEAFANCASLKTVTIPESMTAIPASAFMYCSSLETITLPANLTSIGANAFFGCGNLKTVIYAGDRDDWGNIQIGTGNSILAGVTIKAGDDPVPSDIPVMVSAEATPGKVTVTWEAALNATSYTVMRRQKKSDGSWTAWQNLRVGTTQLKCVDESVTGGTVYAYTVKANTSNLYDQKGLQVKAIAVIPLAITGISADRTSVRPGETITWTASAQGNENPLEYLFYIYKEGTEKEVIRSNNGRYTAQNTFSYTPADVGTYSAKVFLRYKDDTTNILKRTGGSVTVSETVIPTTPTLVSAIASAGQITVKWNAVSGATKYAVYRKTAGGSWTLLTTSATGNSFADKSSDLKAGTTYYYTVRALVSGTWSGYDSKGVSTTAISTTPVLVSATASAGQITVQWNAVSGASKFAVYRKTAGGQWTLLSTSVTGVSYIDNSTELVAGTTYYYTVKSLVSGTWSGYDGKGVSATAISTTPVLVSATASAGQITVQWNAMTGASKFAVYRKTAGGHWTLLSTSVTGVSYIDNSAELVAGTTYYYTVRALVSGTWYGYDSIGVSATAISTTPVLVSATASAGQITVQWNAMTGASKFAVYRKTAGGHWTLLSTSVTGVSYIDNSAELVAGTTYYYTVRALVSGTWYGYDSIGVSATAISTTPVLVSATASAGQITVQWNAVSGASKFAVYRKTAGGHWTLLSTSVTGVSYIDNSAELVAGTTYYYTVKSLVSGTWSGYDAAGVSATAIAAAK